MVDTKPGNVQRSRPNPCPVVPGQNGSQAANSTSDGRYTEVRFEYTPNFTAILGELGASLLVSTYQAGKLVAVGAGERGLSLSFHQFERAMGLTVQPERMAVGTRRQIHFLSSVPQPPANCQTAEGNDSCWIPQSSFYTGNVHSHEPAWGNDGL